MRCYFFGRRSGEIGRGDSDCLFGYAIPDLGILYKDRQYGSLHESQYRGLLALLRFIDDNRKSFRGLEFEILSDAARVIHHLNHHAAVSKELRPIHESVRAYKERISFKANWIPRQENMALSGMHEAPPLEPQVEIRFEDKGYESLERLGKGHLDI